MNFVATRDRVTGKLRGKSVSLLLSLESGLPKIMLWWLGAAALACVVRILVGFVGPEPVSLATLLPYWLLVFAPVASMALALRWFADGDRMPQPEMRLARVGKWRTLSPDQARRHPLYGTCGIMVSLLVGMLMNVPVRAGEYLLAMPATSGPTPAWFDALHFAMTLDVVIVSSLYAIAFVAALRRVPLFPRLLVAIWMIDIVMQVGIARFTVDAGGLPPAVATQLHALLEGNVKKVLISVAIWLPYLLMSRRVNVTYRHRIPA